MANSTDNTPQHPKLAEIKAFCKDMRTMRSGEKAVKARGSELLMHPVGWNDDEYRVYKHRALYPPAVKRTQVVMLGRAFSDSPKISETPLDLNALDKEGMSINGVIRWVTSEVILVGACGLLADFDDSPRLVRYQRENILDWYFDEGRLTYLRLDESGVELDEKFQRVDVIRHRVYMLDKSGFVTSHVETFSEGGEVSVDPGSEAEPRVKGIRLEKIPFQFIGDPDEIDSLLSSIADLSLRYYDMSALLNWLLAKVAAPQFIITWDSGTDIEQAKQFLQLNGFLADDGAAVEGEEPDGYKHHRRTNREKTVSMGAGTVMNLLGAKAEYVGAPGDGLSALDRNLEVIRQQLIAAGARAMAEQNRSAIAAETARIENSGEGAVLADVTLDVSNDLTNFMRHVSVYGEVEPITVKLTEEFFNDDNFTMSDFKEAIAAWNVGAPASIPYHVAVEMGLTDLTLEEWEDRLNAGV